MKKEKREKGKGKSYCFKVEAGCHFAQIGKMALLFYLLSFTFYLFSCSSAPKNPGDIFDLRKRAETQLGLGNKQSDRGSLDSAMLLLDDALQLAIAADDPSLRIRVKLSRGNVLFSLGRADEARENWDAALAEAELAGNRELAAICRIHIGRGKLLSPNARETAQAVRDEVSKDITLIKSGSFYTAFAWTVIGIAEKELGRYAEAESAVRRSLAINEKDRRLELAAYDWFMIGSFRSLSGNFRGAQQALETAITFDRRVENSWGLASDWRALGDVRIKAGEREAALAAYQRSAEILRAMGNESAAAETLSRIDR